MNLETIEKYIDGELAGKELLNFEELISTNSSLNRDYRLSLEINKSIVEDDVMQLRETLDYMYNENVKIKRSPNTFAKRKVFYAAASIALLLAIGGFYKNFTDGKMSGSSIYDKYYQPYEVSVTYRSGNTEVDKVFLSALQKYEEREYEKAMVLFEQLLEIKKNDMALNLYSGITYMEEKEYQNASNSFNNIIDNKNNLFVEQAKWYLSLCYVITEDKENAITLLNELVQEESYYKKDAKHILREIN